MSNQGTVDLQVNGYAGVDFNSNDLTPETFHQACEAMRGHGVRAFLPTIITDSVDAMIDKVQAVLQAVNSNSLAQTMVQGFHIEGPFISPEVGYVGAHPAGCVQRADLDATKRLFDACAGQLRIFTLAPEQDAQATITRWLSEQGVIVSGGHTNASTSQLQRAIDNGLSMITHLGNGCPVTLHRHDNIIQRVLAVADQLHVGFIADGFHVPLFALRNYIRSMPADRAFVVTDAIAAAGLPAGKYQLGEKTVTVRDDDAPRFDDSGNFAGSAATMPMMAGKLASAGFSEGEIQQLCDGTPARIIGID